MSKIKNQQIDELEMLDLGLAEYPDLVVTDEVLMDLWKVGYDVY